MCINGGEKQDGPKTCGQAGYVIYNTSPESFLKFKQVESAADFNRIDNYEYRYALDQRHLIPYFTSNARAL